MNDIIATVIVYNKSINDSSSIKCLSNINNIDLLVIDNSETDYHNQELCEKLNIHYLSNGGNIGLSKAYNIITNKLLNSPYKYILLCDDDTEISQAYIDEINTLIKEDYDIIIPRIIDGDSGNVYSPKVYNNTPFLTKVYNDQPYKYIKAINSGLCIKLSIFNEFKYNENNFLYFVDVDLFENYVNKKPATTKVTNTSLVQNLSHLTESLSDGQITQMQLRLKDSKAFNNWLTHNTYKLAFVMQMYLRYKDKRLLSLLRI